MAKDKAFKPCDKKSSHHSLQNRNHKVHMLLNSCSKNSQKRKFDQHTNGGKFSSRVELVGKFSSRFEPNEEDIDIVDSLRNFLPSRGNHLSRSVVPIGPRFQAEVPKWEATTNIKQYNNDDCLKWLGTQIWPMSTICKSTAKGIEKGIFDSCLCCNRKLVDCVEKHNGEA
ncbi:hypothetical protein P8452_60001 [Trifolium repens]|nr:AT-rich interactive domain-containing protein [Trifolium repens]WJX76601.1 hypothetical protein P8452_60001 [Trifolium repens]